MARALHRRKMLAGLVTDLWISPRSPWRLCGHNESLAGRYEDELRDAVVKAPNARMLAFGVAAKLLKRPASEKILAENSLFQREAGRILAGWRLGDGNYTLFSYSYAARELFREAKKRGWRTVLGQIDPGPGEQKIVDELRAKHPEWAGHPGAVPPPYYWEQWREECELADRIVVNSGWSKSLLVKEGIAAEKIDVVPLAYEESVEKGACSKEIGDQKSETTGRSDRWRVASGETYSAKLYPVNFSRERPMRVLFLGQANVRKGIQDLVAAARELGEGPWHFDVVGRHPALPAGIPSSVVFHGQVPRRDARAWYEKADVFLLPTHSDGFALTQLEAMAHGLPVVATPCCGAVVKNGVNGLIVPPGDPDALAEAIRGLSEDPRRLASMSAAARETVGDFGVDRVGHALTGDAE